MNTSPSPVKNNSLFRKASRFGLTGIFITFLHLAIATLIIHFLTPNASIANGVAFIAANITSYVMHTLWSFSEKLHGQNLFRFLVVSLIGFVISIAVPSITQGLSFTPLIGTLSVILILPPLNFLLHNFWTYK